MRSLSGTGCNQSLIVIHSLILDELRSRLLQFQLLHRALSLFPIRLQSYSLHTKEIIFQESLNIRRKIRIHFSQFQDLIFFSKRFILFWYLSDISHQRFLIWVYIMDINTKLFQIIGIEFDIGTKEIGHDIVIMLTLSCLDSTRRRPNQSANVIYDIL